MANRLEQCSVSAVRKRVQVLVDKCWAELLFESLMRHFGVAPSFESELALNPSKSCFNRGFEHRLPWSEKILEGVTEKAILSSLADFLAIQQQWAQLENQLGPGTQLVRVNRNFKSFQDAVVARVQFQSTSDILLFSGKLAQFEQQVQDLKRVVVGLNTTCVDLPLKDLLCYVVRNAQALLELGCQEQQVFAQVLAYAQAMSPGAPSIPVRQLPIARAHTKWIETHQKLIDRFLIEVLKKSGNDFESRLGVSKPPTLVWVEVVCPSIAQTYTGGLRSLAMPLSQFLTWLTGVHNRWVGPLNLLMVENKNSAQGFAAQPGLIVIHSLGKAVAALSAYPEVFKPWNRRNPLRQVAYFGDLDVEGFEMLSTVRGIFPHCFSLLMDEATFGQYADLAVQGNIISRAVPGSLHDAESSLCARLLDPSDSWFSKRLEQERLPWSLVSWRVETCFNEN